MGLATLMLATSIAATGVGFHDHLHQGGILPPGPGYGWGFPLNKDDLTAGWYDAGDFLPLGGARTVEYFFRRQYSVIPEQLMPSTYYNPYIMRGQRYISYSGCGGWHPAGGQLRIAATPVYPYQNAVGTGNPVVTPPSFSGRVEAPPIPSGSSGMLP